MFTEAIETLRHVIISHVFTIGPQLVVLFGKIVEDSGSKASLEEVYNWRWALRFYSSVNFLFTFSTS